MEYLKPWKYDLFALRKAIDDHADNINNIGVSSDTLYIKAMDKLLNVFHQYTCSSKCEFFEFFRGFKDCKSSEFFIKGLKCCIDVTFTVTKFHINVDYVRLIIYNECNSKILSL